MEHGLQIRYNPQRSERAERPSPIPEREIHVGWGSENSVLTHQESDSLSDNTVMCAGRRFGCASGA
ncbi:hypothetical protein LB505_009489 [Fusarium chuoi]|nr:hypothetical protein LB505_009489 [Fusarium chuoi]